MMYGSSLRLLGLGCVLALAGACAADDGRSNSGFSISGVSNVTQGTNPTGESASSTGAMTTGDLSSTGEPPVTTGDESDGGTTSPASGTTTTGVDPSTTSNTTTGVDPSTTTGDDTTGGMMTSNTTADDTTGEPPPPPPPKDPQPVAGPYEHCLTPDVCDANTDVCLTLNDAANKPTDGFCTLYCDNVNDCGPKPAVPAVQECVTLDPMTKLCALKCTGLKDCPTGMVCANTQLGMFCF